MKYWHKMIIFIGTAIGLLVFPITRRLLIMIAPIGVKPDDIVVLVIIAVLLIWYFIHRIKNASAIAQTKLHNVSILTSEREKLLIKKAERRDGLKANIMITAELLLEVSKAYTIKAAALRLSRNLLLLRTLDDKKWDNDQNLRRLATYYCETVTDVYSAWVSNKKDEEFTKQVISLFDGISDAIDQLLDQVQSENISSAEIDIKVAHDQLFNNFGIKKEKENL